MKQNYLITIIGPTAIGKTALSIALAQHFGCEIISCDSRQFYKEMTIGTAVPNHEELASAKHHFIQNKSIFETYTVGDFEKEAILKLEELFQKNNIQVMVGGSGLYADAVLNGLDTFPEINPEIRTKVRQDFEEKGLNFLIESLKNLDSNYFDFLSNTNPQTFQNPQRMMRFIEVCLSTSKPYSTFLDKQKTKRNFIPIIIGLEANREIMYDRINQRVDIMIQQGLLNEAKSVHLNKNLNALQTVGYRELFDFFENEISLEFAIEEIKKNTRRFAKRQITWFKRTENTIWFDYLTDKKEIVNAVKMEI